MRRAVLLAAALAAGVLTGCRSAPAAADTRHALVRMLAGRGVTDANTDKIVVVGGEADWGADTEAVIEYEFGIQEIWDAICQSRPYAKFVFSGYRRLRFYTTADEETLAAELLVNATDRCHFADAPSETYRCPGVNRITNAYLKAAYEKRRGR